MSSTPQSVKDDLAFMRSLVEAGDSIQGPFGEAYLAAGVCYGVQIILSAAQSVAWLPATEGWSLTIGLAPTVVFLAALASVIRWHRHAAPMRGVWRAIAAVFGCIGLANLALVAVIGSVAVRQHSMTTWLIYPCAVLVEQGAAWLVAFVLLRRAWLALVAVGWFAVAIVMACLIQTTTSFLVAAGIGLMLLMVVPGTVMIRLARASATAFSVHVGSLSDPI
jgi:hypothetical protein